MIYHLSEQPNPACGTTLALTVATSSDYRVFAFAFLVVIPGGDLLLLLLCFDIRWVAARFAFNESRVSRLCI